MFATFSALPRRFPLPRFCSVSVYPRRFWFSLIYNLKCARVVCGHCFPCFAIFTFQLTRQQTPLAHCATVSGSRSGAEDARTDGWKSNRKMGLNSWLLIKYTDYCDKIAPGEEPGAQQKEIIARNQHKEAKKDERWGGRRPRGAQWKLIQRNKYNDDFYEPDINCNGQTMRRRLRGIRDSFIRPFGARLIQMKW